MTPPIHMGLAPKHPKKRGSGVRSLTGNTMQDEGLVVMGENNSLRVFESSLVSPIVDE